MVVEFVYSVYVSTSALYNYRDAQNLSSMASSGIKVAISYLDNYLASLEYSTIDNIALPVTGLSDDGSGEVLVLTIQDECAKFNVNSIVFENGELNDERFASFVRLIEKLQLDKDVAYRIADWIDYDVEERILNGEKHAKNYFLFSLDELMMIDGITVEFYKELRPFVTIYGAGLININTASPEVLYSLSANIDETLAVRLVEYRKEGHAFEKTYDILNVAGFEDKGTSLMGKISVKSTVFAINSTAKTDEIVKVVDAIIERSATGTDIKYWKEF